MSKIKTKKEDIKFGNIHEVITYIQGKLKCPKNQRNSFGNYKYRNCEDILESLKPLLQETKCYLKMEDDVIPVEGRFYVKSTVTLFHTQSDSLQFSTGLARECDSKKGMDLSQITGSCSSYARKYALNGLFAIDDTKDSDYTNIADKPSKYTTKPIEIVKKEYDSIPSPSWAPPKKAESFQVKESMPPEPKIEIMATSKAQFDFGEKKKGVNK